MERAIGMVEYNSIARGIYASDQMVKTSEVDIVTAGVNEALKTVESANAEAMAKVTGAAGMPGLF